MNFDRALNIVGSIVTVALVATVLGSANTAAIINSLGSAFSHSIASAQGRAS